MTRTLVVGLLFFVASTPVFASEPTVDGIDYASPQSYLEIAPSLGDPARIVELASQLKGRDDRATIRRVLEWMTANLKCEPDRAYKWRNFDDVVAEGCYGGCADEGIVCGVLLKAAGIPVVWVKTMDVEWIWDFKKKRPFEAWSGHVFLEVYLEDEWRLLDPGAKLLYSDYLPDTRILPGNRFAYHKGSDPRQMVMSLQWEDWKAQTSAYFEQLDERLLPLDAEGGVSVVPQVYIVGNDPYYKVLGEMARAKGWSVKGSFNTDYDNQLPKAKGHTLLIETHRGRPVVPLDVLERSFPESSKALATKTGVIEINGTTIMFVELARALDPLDELDQ